MSEQSSSLLGYGLYFIDVLACLLFCVTLALVGARFGNERSLEISLPELERGEGTGGDLTGTTITLRADGDELELTLDGEAIAIDDLGERLSAARTPSIIVRSEASSLARVIGIAHGAGVNDIRLAYAVRGDGSGAREAR